MNSIKIKTSYTYNIEKAVKKRINTGFLSEIQSGLIAYSNLGDLVFTGFFVLKQQDCIIYPVIALIFNVIWLTLIV
jgi:hypothetical protein